MTAFPGHLTGVDLICKKVGRKIGALRRTYRQLTPMKRRQFFVSVIQPDLEYAASATSRSCRLVNKIDFWHSVRYMAGVQPQIDVLLLIRNLKLTHLTHR